MVENLLNALLSVLQPKLLLINLLAVSGGYLIGSLPGLTATMGVAILVPLTFSLPPEEGLTAIVAVYLSAVQGGAVSAILINTPGTPASAATVFDGYPMAKKGLAGKAIGMAQISSFSGLLISWILLISISPLIAKMALKFSTPEYFALGVFALSIISSLTSKSPLKGFVACFFGLLLVTIGFDPVEGIPRFTFGSNHLLGGISYIPALIGLFAVSEILVSVEQFGASLPVTQKVKNVLPNLQDIKQCFTTIIRSGLIGSYIGALPGLGGDVASFLAYGEAKRWCKRPEELGTGRIEGVAAAEAANNAVCGGAMIPMMTLGIPGDCVTAIILGALIIRGLNPGSSLFSEHGDVVYVVFAGFLISSILVLILGLSTAKIFARVLNIPKKILLPIILSLCLIGSYAIQSSIFDVTITMLFGIVGYFLSKFGFQGSPIVLALILGPMVEQNLRLSLISSQGSFLIFFNRPICLAFLMVSIVAFTYPFIRPFLRKVRAMHFFS